MEANEKGLWDNGLKFGSVEELSAIFDDIAHRRGIGDELAEGSKRLSDKSQPFTFLRLDSTGQCPAPAPQFQCGQPLSSLSTVYTATSRDLENKACPGSPLPSKE